MSDAYQLVRGIRFNPDELGPDGRIELRLSDCSAWIVEVRNGGLYVDPEMNDQFDRLSSDTAHGVIADWCASSEAYRAAHPGKQHLPPLEIDPEVLEASARNRCRVVIGGNRGIDPDVGGAVVFEFWYLKPLIHIGQAPLGATLRTVALTTRAGERMLVA